MNERIRELTELRSIWMERAKRLRQDPSYTDCAVTLESCADELSSLKCFAAALSEPAAEGFPGFPVDAGGNSALTRLEAEVECNKHKDDYCPVSDTSLMQADIRHILRRLKATEHPPAAKPAPVAGGETKRCAKCGWPIVPEGEAGCWESNCSMRPIPEPPAAKPAPVAEGFITTVPDPQSRTIASGMVRDLAMFPPATPSKSNEERANWLRADTLLVVYTEGNGLKAPQPIDWSAWQRVSDYVNAAYERMREEATKAEVPTTSMIENRDWRSGYHDGWKDCQAAIRAIISLNERG